MSEPPPDNAKPARPRISEEGLKDALQRAVTRGCPMCDGIEFDVRLDTIAVIPVTDNPDGTTHTTITQREGGHTAASTGIVAVPVVCRSCGFIAQFHYDTLLER